MDLGEKESPVVVEKKARVEMVERERRVSAVVAKPVVQQQQSQEVILKVSYENIAVDYFVAKFNIFF